MVGVAKRARGLNGAQGYLIKGRFTTTQLVATAHQLAARRHGEASAA